MKKLSLFLVTMLLASSFVMADDHDENHSKIRPFVSPEFNLMENPKTSVMTGMFKKMSVLVEKNTDKKKGYKGWVIKEGKKLPLSLFYKNKKLHGDFNGNKFAYSSMNKKDQSYTFKTDKGETKVSYLYEIKEGRRMGNPLFIVKNNKRHYLIRLEGGCCVSHGLYYAAVFYGLTTFDEVQKSHKKTHKEHKEEDHDHDHDHEHDH